MSLTFNVENGQKMSDYPKSTEVSSGEDIFLVRLSNGGVEAMKLSVLKKWIAGDTAGLTTEDKASLVAAINEVAQKAGNLDNLTKLLSRPGASRANSVITEYSLGTSLTDDQSNDIRTGTFDLVRPGGYWTINGRKYWVAHADYALRCGDTELKTHHVVVVPDVQLATATWNTENVTTGGYANSEIRTETLPTVLETVKGDFGDGHILKRRAMLGNATSNGATSGWAWFDSEIDLMNEKMVYGSYAWGGGSQSGYDTGCDKTQLALFAARPDLISNRQNWWLRDVQSAASAALVSNHGLANAWNASNVLGVRPAFLVY